MWPLPWVAEHWFELLQTVGIIGGLVFTAYTVRKDDSERQIANLLAIKQQHREIWKELYDRPKLFRVLKKDVDLSAEPVTDEEGLFVKLLFLHLDAVHRSKQAGMFVEIQGLSKDIREFLALPIPREVWNRLEPFQDKEFIAFVEAASK
jgi:hypothetical protein